MAAPVITNDPTFGHIKGSSGVYGAITTDIAAIFSIVEQSDFDTQGGLFFTEGVESPETEADFGPLDFEAAAGVYNATVRAENPLDSGEFNEQEITVNVTEAPTGGLLTAAMGMTGGMQQFTGGMQRS